MSFNKNELALLVAIAIQHISGSAYAQAGAELPEVKVQSSRELPPTYNPPTATSATKIEAPLRDIPQTVNVVPQQLIQERRSTTLEEALRNVGGVTFSAGEGGQQGDNPIIHGFSARGDIYRDGVRVQVRVPSLVPGLSLPAVSASSNPHDFTLQLQQSGIALPG